MPRRDVVVTGGSGSVATLLRPHLDPGAWRVRLLDLVPPATPTRAHEEHHELSVLDTDGLRSAFAGADLVVHLAGHKSERPWPDIASANMDGTRSVLEAAVSAGVPRVLLASSLHAVGFTSAGAVGSSPEPSPRPDTYYGVSKVVVEALGRLYADRYGLGVVSARLGTVEERPSSVRSLSLWLAPADLARLVTATADLDAPGGHVVWAVSDNTRGWVDLSAGRAIGFVPREDAHRHAGSLVDDEPLPPETVLAGGFLGPDRPLGGTW